MFFLKEKPPVKIFEFLFPITYGVIFYSWLIISEKILHSLRPPVFIAYIFFLPVIVMETCSTCYFLNKEKIPATKRSCKLSQIHTSFYQFFIKLFSGPYQLLGYAIRLVLQFFVFYVWVVCFLKSSLPFTWMSSHTPYLLQCLWLFQYARPLNSLLMLIPLVTLYLFIWGKWKIGRTFFGVILPIGFLFTSYILFYLNIFGGQSKGEVTKQPEVSIILPFDNFNCTHTLLDTFQASIRFPRCLQANWQKRRLYLSFGSIGPDTSTCPNLLTCDLEGKNEKTFSFPQPEVNLIKTCREFQLDPQDKNLYISGWYGSYSYVIFELDPDNLSILEEIPFNFLRQELKDYNLYDMVSDGKNERLFLATGQPPAIVRIDLVKKTGKILNLTKIGITEFGSILHILRYDKTLNRIYAVAVTGDRGGLLIEVDPENMLLARVLSLPGLGISIEIDSERNEILVGMGLKNRILAVDRKTFNIKYAIPTPSPTVRRFDIDSKTGLLYVVDYLRGYLHIIKRDSGKIVKAYKVGNKPLGMVRNGQNVYVASVLGIIKIEIPESTAQLY